MTRTTPDEVFAAAARAELERRVDAERRRMSGATSVRPARRQFVVTAVASVVVLAIVAAVTFGLMNLPHRDPAAPSLTPPASACRKSADSVQVHGTRPFGCKVFTSVKGADHDKSLPWLTSNPLSVSIRMLKGTPTAIISAPCNTYDVPLALSTTRMVPVTTHLSGTAATCSAATTSEDDWVVEFFSRSIDYSFNSGLLLLKSDSARLILKVTADQTLVKPVPPVTWDPTLSSPARHLAATKRLPACALSHLTVWAQPSGGGALGTFYQSVFVRNDGADCSLIRSNISIVVGDNALHAKLGLEGPAGLSLLPSGVSERLVIGRTEACNSGPAAASPGADRMSPLTLVVGSARKKLAATFPFASTCGGLGFNVWSLTDASDFRSAGAPDASPDLTVSIHVPNSELKATGSLTGGTMTYSVTVKNHGSTTFEPATCPSFTQVAVGNKTVVVQRGTLNCLGVGSIAPGGTRTYSMQIAAPHGDEYDLGWYLGGGAGD